jgi:uncharacterized protein (DUF58 family)
MTRRASPRLVAYTGIAAAGLLVGLVLGKPAVVALAAPFALVLAVGLALARDPAPTVALRLDRERALEGEEALLELTLSAPRAVDHLEALVVLPGGLEVIEGRAAVAVRLDARTPHTTTIRLRCARWGAHALGEVRLRARDTLGLLVWDGIADVPAPLRVYPRPEVLGALLRPLRTQALTGDQVSRLGGEGVEAADVRPFAPGDRIRSVNWRATARRGALHVTDRHPERNADVVLLVDGLAEARLGAEGTLDLALRAAAGLGRGYARGRDRLGLLVLGGVLRWLAPGLGLRQAYRVVDALLDAQVSLSYAWPGFDRVPPGTLPPGAMVLALTPLVDERVPLALLDLRARGFDLVVIEVSPLPFAPPSAGPTGELAHRLWRLRREELRTGLRRAGATVVEWRQGVPFEAALEEARAVRRAARAGRLAGAAAASRG